MTIDQTLLTEYETRLASLRLETVGFVEALFVSPCPNEHLPVPRLQSAPGHRLEGR